MRRSKGIVKTYFKILHEKCHSLLTISEIHLQTQSGFPPTYEYFGIVMSLLPLPSSFLQLSAVFSKSGFLAHTSYLPTLLSLSLFIVVTLFY